MSSRVEARSPLATPTRLGWRQRAFVHGCSRAQRLHASRQAGSGHPPTSPLGTLCTSTFWQYAAQELQHGDGSALKSVARGDDAQPPRCANLGARATKPLAGGQGGHRQSRARKPGGGNGSVCHNGTLGDSRWGHHASRVGHGARCVERSGGKAIMAKISRGGAASVVFVYHGWRCTPRAGGTSAH